MPCPLFLLLCINSLLWGIEGVDIDLFLPFTSLFSIMWLEMLSFCFQINVFNTVNQFVVFLTYSSPCSTRTHTICGSCTLFTSVHVDSTYHTVSFIKSLSFNSASKSIFNAHHLPFIDLQSFWFFEASRFLRKSLEQLFPEFLHFYKFVFFLGGGQFN